MRALLLAVLLLAPASSYGQSGSMWKQLELSGRVRTMRIEAERTDAEGNARPRQLVQTRIFDERGNPLEYEEYNLDGSRKWKLRWGHEYDDDGREIKTYYYNEDGKLTNTGVTKYDDKGHAIETTQINPNGSINHIRSYSYDKENRVREAHRNENGSPRNLITRNYDPKGLLVEEVYMNSDGSLINRNVMTYDERGKRTGLTVFKSDGTVIQVFRKAFSYDSRGNVKEIINYAADQSITSKESYTYDFDDRGNWIKRRMVRALFTEGQPKQESETTYRILTYF